MNTEWLVVFMCLFTRTSAMLMAAPLLGTSVPVQMRVLIGAVIAMALSPAIMTTSMAMPAHMGELVLMFVREALCGVLIGACMHLAVAAVEMAGSIADLQLGLMSAQVFSPTTGGVATPTARFKFMLAIVVLFSVDGHHLMLQALAKSYRLPSLGFHSFADAQPHLMELVGQIFALSIQIAAPVAAVGFLVDLSAGLINKAVPQTQPFLLAMPAKLAMGLAALSLGLPAAAFGANHAISISFGALSKMLGG